MSLPEEEAFKAFWYIKAGHFPEPLGKNLYTLKLTASIQQMNPLQKLETLRKYHMNELKVCGQISFDSIIGSHDSSENYLIIVVNGLYDIPGVTSDDQELEDASDEVYSYILTCICPGRTGWTRIVYRLYKACTILDKERGLDGESPVNAFIISGIYRPGYRYIHHALYFAKSRKFTGGWFLKELIGSEMISCPTKKSMNGFWIH